MELDNDTLLNRSVSSSWVQGDFVSSQTFTPTPKDEGKLSVFNNDLLDPESTYKYYTGTLDLKSAGIISISVAECTLQDLDVSPDPDSDPKHDAHVAIDYNKFGKSKRKKIGGELRDSAKERGWQYISVDE